MKPLLFYYFTFFSTIFMSAQIESLPKIHSQETFFGKTIIDDYQYSEDQQKWWR